MQLPKLTLVPPKIQSGDLFPALELVMSSKALEEAIAITDSQEKRFSVIQVPEKALMLLSPKPDWFC